ncbi:MAG: glutamyl-tRNA reductase [Spirochaetota bacterium]
MKKNEYIPHIAMIGMSHKTAPVEARECFSWQDQQLVDLYEKIRDMDVDEAVYITTCNRVEIYITSADVHLAVDELVSLLEKYAHSRQDNLETMIYKKYSRDAVEQLLTVVSSLDSMVVGENEIIGQVKESYREAVQQQMTGTVLNRLFHQAFKTAKRVRTETEISRNPLSVAYIATELARKIFDDLSRRNALLIGAGEMGELILKYMTKFNLQEITIANRSLHNAERIAEEINRDARIVSLDDIADVAGSVDIIISSVTAPGYMITREMVDDIVKQRGSRPLFMIDIAVPRNIDPDVAEKHSIFLYNVDDLEKIADENLKNRLREMELAAALIQSDVDEFFDWYEELEVVPVIVKMQKTFENIRRSELRKYRKRKMKHLSEEDFQLVEELTSQIMTKSLHNPIVNLKKIRSDHASKGHSGKTLKEKTRIIEELFDS